MDFEVQECYRAGGESGFHGIVAAASDRIDNNLAGKCRHGKIFFIRSGDHIFLRGSAVSHRNAAGGIQRQQQSDKTTGVSRDNRRSGDERREKGAVGGSYDLCGKCGIYDTAASAVDHLIWRTTQR